MLVFSRIKAAIVFWKNTTNTGSISRREFIRFNRNFSQEKVMVDMDGDIEESIIQGLDEHGYLQVKNRTTGALSHVTDNGNSFDMMKGLIRAKFC